MPLWNSREREKKGKYNRQNKTVSQHLLCWHMMTISVVSFIFEIRKKKMTLVLPLSVLQFHYKKSGSLVTAQFRNFNYSELWWKKRKICGVSMHFPGFDHLFAHSIWYSHTRPVQSMILESDSVLCVVILWIIYTNFSWESKHNCVFLEFSLSSSNMGLYFSAGFDIEKAAQCFDSF